MMMMKKLEFVLLKDKSDEKELQQIIFSFSHYHYNEHHKKHCPLSRHQSLSISKSMQNKIII